MRRSTLAASGAVTVLVGSVLAGIGATSAAAAPKETAPKHVFATRGDAQPQGQAKPGGGSRVRTNGISYHGGPIITGTVNAYYIWYGDWSGNAVPTSDVGAQSLLNNLANKIGGSSYFNINTTYYNGAGTRVSNSVALAGSKSFGYTHGKTLSDADIQAIVGDAFAAGLPKDTNGVYFVLTSGDVSESSGFLTQYCGWHTNGTFGGSDIKYSFVGDPYANPSACEAQLTSPNGNASADGMASVIAHELEEATTDPDLNAWYDSRGYENADKCAWTFGTTSTASNGSKYNVTLGTTEYLIQRNWVNASGGYCSMSY